MIIKSVEFTGSAVDPKQYPIDRLPEIVLCGRSNVGKSTFINTMLNNSKLARVSSTPGKTRLINFFRINNGFYLVDLPGYGYAKVSYDLQDDFKVRIEKYISNRPVIKAAVILMDLRREPNEQDHQIVEYFQAKWIPTIIVLTKADKLSNNERFKQLEIIRKSFPEMAPERFYVYSSVTKENLDVIWTVLENQINRKS